MSHTEFSNTLPGPFLLLPFLLQLLAIALMPFLAHHWWERHHPKVSVSLGGFTALYYCLFLHGEERFWRRFVVMQASLS